jgi:hypothetical protein
MLNKLNKVNCDNVTLSILPNKYNVTAKEIRKDLKGSIIQSTVTYAKTNKDGKEEVFDLEIILGL